MPGVLLVEADPDIREILGGLLGRHGFEVVGVRDPAQACEELRRRDFDAVLGALLLDRVTTEEKWQGVDDVVRLAGPAAVGLLTGWSVTRAELEQHGLAFLVEKPFSSETLLGKLSAALDIPSLPDAQRAAVEAYFAAIERADWDGLVGACAADVIYHLPSVDSRFGRTVAGRASFRELAEATFGEFREPRFAIESVRALPRGAAVRYVGSWTTEDGARSSMPGSVLFVFEGDRISEIGVRVDVEALRRVA